MNSFEYTTNKASETEIKDHLNQCDHLFNPPLSSYVSINDYTNKIKTYATIFEAWDNNTLVGLVACYLNDEEKKNGHITNVTVLKKEQRKGIAENLVLETINESLNRGYKTITLEVEDTNTNAIKLYQKLNFTLAEKIGSKYTMVNRINENKNMMVSICCITYNHEKYIAQAIDSFLMQKTNFPFEVLIHDDASTDGTADIIREYEAKYPNTIKPIYQTENQYSKGIKISTTYNFPRAKGKYIAMCEGDDYWTDPNKLQKQVDVLEKNENCIACHHWHEYLFEYADGSSEIKPAPKKGDGYYPQKISPVKEIFDNNLRIKTRTVIYRNIFKSYHLPHWFNKVAFGDVPLSMLMGQHGDFYFIDEVMAVYRQTDSGVSSAGRDSLSPQAWKEDHFKKWIKIWDYGNKEHSYRYKKEADKTTQYFNSIIYKQYYIKDKRWLTLFIYNLFIRNTKLSSKLNDCNAIVTTLLKKVYNRVHS